MNLPVPVRIAALILAALAITLSAMGALRRSEAPPAPVAPAATATPDPLRPELRRCQLLGQGALDDPACLAVWVESRDRFLGRGAGDGR